MFTRLFKEEPYRRSVKLQNRYDKNQERIRFLVDILDYNRLSEDDLNSIANILQAEGESLRTKKDPDHKKILLRALNYREAAISKKEAEHIRMSELIEKAGL